MKRLWDILKNVDFYAQNELKGGPGAESEFFSKIRPRHFTYFMIVLLHAKFQKNLMNGSPGKCVNGGRTDGRTEDGRTDRGYFYGPFS